MKRREFIALVGGALAARPLTAYGQLAADNRLVGGSSPPSPTTQSYANRDFPARPRITSNWRDSWAVRTENLNPEIMVMKSAENRV